MTAKRDLTNMTFGRWFVIKEFGRETCGRFTWLCRCSCGTEKVVKGRLLMRGLSKSCGCWSRELSKKNKTHGMTRTKTYKAWWSMIARCNPTGRYHKRYYDRGITICEEWKKFDTFLSDMGVSPVGTQLDRIDNNAGYSKNNCRWTTPEVNANNKENSVIIHYMGEDLSISQWARRLGIRRSLISVRYKKGYPLDMVFYDGKFAPRDFWKNQVPVVWHQNKEI